MKRILFITAILILMIKIDVYADAYVMPLPFGSYSVSSEYGMRIHPVTGELSMHYGIDLGALTGVDVYASTAGTAHVYYSNETAGNYIEVVESSGYYTRYLHLSEILINDNDVVTQGQLIGKVGNTGLSTGSHLHFGVVQAGEYINPRNVLTFTNEAVLPENAEPLQMWLNNNHETGQITLYVNGYFPIQVYKSEDNVTFTLMSALNSNYYKEYGLTNGKTYWYRIVDYFGRTRTERYTPPITNINMNPLTLTYLDDTSAHFKWTEYAYDLHLYLDDVEVFTSTNGVNEYTITGLEPNTTHTVRYVNYEHDFSNKVTFTTPDNLGRFEAMLKRLFIPDDIDSNSDGIPDNLEPIKQKMDDIQNKIGGQTISDVKDTIETAANNPYFSGGDERLADIPKIQIDYMGIQGNVFDIGMEELAEYIGPIRNLVLAILVVGFIYALLALFNIVWKV